MPLLLPSGAHEMAGEFGVEVVTELKPQDNTLLEGLYKSSGNYSTQVRRGGREGGWERGCLAPFPVSNQRVRDACLEDEQEAEQGPR